jgi:predicted RNase H-like HicB family nuclease
MSRARAARIPRCVDPKARLYTSRYAAQRPSPPPPVQNVALRDAEAFVQALGVELREVEGSHRTYARDDIDEIINLQERQGEARDYQLRQIARIVAHMISAWRTELNDYQIVIFYSEPDQAYIADVPDLPGCSAVGDTPEEALAEVQVAKRLCLWTAERMGKAIPRPSYRPALS